MKKLSLLALSILFTTLANAQDVEMADGLRSSGKIYVVVGSLVTILLGVIVYLVIIDRKVSDIEKKINK